MPTKLLWLSLHSLEMAPVTPGTPVLIAGTVTNRSRTQTLDATIEGVFAPTGSVTVWAAKVKATITGR